MAASLSVSTVGHLVELPLTSGDSTMVDPAEVVEVATPRGQHGITLVRLRDQTHAHYVQADYSQVKACLRAAMAA
jgi:hypothetical protein